MDALLNPIRDAVEGEIDFDGQALAETFYTYALTFTTQFSLLLGFVYRDIYVALWVGLLGFVLTMLLVVPPWPFYKQNPQKWLGSKSKIQVPSSGITIESTKIT